MEKLNYYAVARSMYGLLRNKHISYRGHLLVEARRKARHQVSNFVLHRNYQALGKIRAGGLVMEIMLIDFAICLISTIAVMCIAMCYVHIKLGRDKA